MAKIDNPQLRAIAHALGIKPEVLFNGTPEIEANEATILLQLWSKIEDPQGRQRVLSVLRQEAERCGFRK
jgi:hypothetical protein